MLRRVSKELILEAVRVGEEAARKIADLKKAAMAERAEQLLAGRGRLPPPAQTRSRARPSRRVKSRGEPRNAALRRSLASARGRSIVSSLQAKLSSGLKIQVARSNTSVRWRKYSD